MAETITFNIEGAKEMERVLDLLGPQIARSLGQAAARAGAKIIVEEAKRLVPVQTGDLKESIVIKALPNRARGEDQAGVLIGFEKPTSRIAHLVEFGTSNSAAQPFMRPAMDGKAPDALDAMGKSMAAGIKREANKLSKGKG